MGASRPTTVCALTSTDPPSVSVVFDVSLAMRASSPASAPHRARSTRAGWSGRTPTGSVRRPLALRGRRPEGRGAASPALLRVALPVGCSDVAVPAARPQDSTGWVSVLNNSANADVVSTMSMPLDEERCDRPPPTCSRSPLVAPSASAPWWRGDAVRFPSAMDVPEPFREERDDPPPLNVGVWTASRGGGEERGDPGCSVVRPTRGSAAAATISGAARSERQDAVVGGGGAASPPLDLANDGQHAKTLSPGWNGVPSAYLDDGAPDIDGSPPCA